VADQLARIIYLCAFVPRDGDSLVSLSELMPPSQLPPVQTEADAVSARTTRCARGYLHAGRALCGGQLGRAAVPCAGAGAMLTPVALTGEHYTKLSKSYIVCTRDRAIDRCCNG
jgi:hypothetical protein